MLDLHRMALTLPGVIADLEALQDRLRDRDAAQAPETLADAAEKLEAWRRYYNEDRPHGAIRHKVPISLTKHGGITSPPP